MDPRRLIIINEFDRPCIKLLMWVESDGTAHYLNEHLITKTAQIFNDLSEASTLEDFGFEHVEMGVYKKTKPSKATYSDGRIIEWQDKEVFQYEDIIHAYS